jgi:outer membrane protein assembly factor BamB
MPTGGDLRSVRAIRAGGRHLVVVLAGTVLQAFDPDGRRRWALPSVPVSRLVDAGDLDGTGAGCILVRAGARTLLLLDATSGRERWRWRAEPGTFVSDHAGVLLAPFAGGSRLVVCPTYATSIVAFDLVGDGPPRERWEVAGPWDAGFGPSVVAADVDGDGTAELILSSRMGHGERVVAGRVDEAKRVLGRRQGLLYQAVHDLATGERRGDVTYAPDPRRHRCARPYGLLTARSLAPGEPPAIVLASCQVEEYLAVTRQRRDGRLARGWGRFIEKDWPRDERELRVHPDALADLRGDGRLELVVSLWEAERWVTRVVDPALGWAAARAELADRVCWGVVNDASGRAALVLSRETVRATGVPTDLELRDGRDLAVVGRLGTASVVVTEDAPLAPDTAFMARRRGGTVLAAPDGSRGIVVRRWSGGSVRSIVLWSPGAAAGSPVQLARGDAVRVDPGPDSVLVGRPDGTVEARSPGGRDPGVRLVAEGRTVRPVARVVSGHAELVVDVAGGRLAGVPLRAGRRPRTTWSMAGRLPSATSDPGRALLFVETGAGPWALEAWADPGGPSGPAWRVPLDAPLDQPALPLPGGRVALTLRTGIHALATELRARDGSLIARFPLGAYLHPPALLDVPGDPLLVLDDHGILAAIDLDGRERWRRDWTAAYSMPITGPFLRGGAAGIVRASGIHGVALLDRAGRGRWRHDAPLWRYAAGRAALFLTDDGPALAMPRRDGMVEAVSVASGAPRWALPLGGEVEHASVTSGDVDGDGRDELLVGLPDGRLLCVADEAATPRVRWTVDLGAGVDDAWLAAVDGGPGAGIVVATADGAVRVLA